MNCLYDTISPSPSSTNLTGAAMESQEPVRQLMARYQLRDVMAILRTIMPYLNEHGKALTLALEAQHPLTMCSQPSPASTWPSFRTDDVFFANQSSRTDIFDTNSATSSIHSPLLSNHTIRSSTPQLPTRPPAAYLKETHRPAPNHHAPKRKPIERLECPFCFEVGITSSVARKADLIRHFEGSHHTDTQWQCPEPGCSSVFDWRSAFVSHMKEVHQNTKSNCKKAEVALCPQVVFSCGFCDVVFEASGDQDASQKADEYFKHVANHYHRDRFSHRDWSYSTRFRNMLQHLAVGGFGVDLQWQPHTTRVLRKVLETRHFSDIQLLLTCAVILGTEPYDTPSKSPLPSLPLEFSLPVKDICSIGQANHQTMQQSSPHPHLTTNFSMSQPNDYASFQHEGPATHVDSQPYPHPHSPMNFSTPPPNVNADFQQQNVATYADTQQVGLEDSSDRHGMSMEFWQDVDFL
ncbi:hypothetical protein B0T17DRAFT_297897 [Bombardia bombarda]|uniref:C2H2-type domain-containing protein n=1 Tax=Bombardia bombarda TaxID=252184 RepID=A0AA39WU62_9PEZI|nr:hypothetical protein B0T17DRAFT_297897 [Bombardia bombarda]